MGSTIFLVVIAVMAGVALTGMLVVGGPGDQWQTLLRALLLAAYAGGFLLGLGGLFVVARRVLS